MKKILLMAMVAGVLFACNKQEPTDSEGENATGKRDVTLSIKQDALSRGITDQKEDVEYAVIGSGKIYFLDASSANIYQRELTTAEINILQNTTTTPGGNTITITGVPNTAKSLFFLANTRTTDGPTFPIVDGMGSAGARIRVDKLQGDALHVPMSGRSGDFTPGVGTTQVATVLITPLVARIELGQITCQNQNGSGSGAVSSDITGYKLSGVFINSVRPSVLLGGTPYLPDSPIDIKAQSGWSNGSDTYFMPFNTSFPYYLGGSPSGPNDWVLNSFADHCTPTTAGLTFYPDPTTGSTDIAPGLNTNLAWAYQVAPSAVVNIGSAADVPHIILKLTEVTYNQAELKNPLQYITVTKYKDATSGSEITEFQRGNVYRITNLIFTHTEATNEPYQKDITVTATVTVAPWVINSMNPDWN